MTLAEHVVRTPLLAYQAADGRFEGSIFLKAEHLQPFSSYKIRGVATAVAAASEETVRAGLSAASAGNMGQAVAFAARAAGAPCTIFVPDAAPEVKKNAIRRLGATLEERPFSEIWEAVSGSGDLGAPGLFVHPTRTETLRIGYGAIGVEIVTDRPEVEALVVPFGLGGLALGIVDAVKAVRPDVAVYVVEPETAAPMAASMRQGRAVKVDRRPTFIDAIGTPEVLAPVYAALKDKLAAALTVSVAEAEAAVADLFRSQKMIVEGAAACGLAAARRLVADGVHKRVAAVMTGANIDEATLQDILRRHGGGAR